MSSKCFSIIVSSSLFFVKELAPCSSRGVALRQTGHVMTKGDMLVIDKFARLGVPAKLPGRLEHTTPESASLTTLSLSMSLVSISGKDDEELGLL